ncbi:hypothetical protein MMC29_005549 [Sticta canariensis]|nr:hypothetical protein [Sticta canariensis]
MSSPRAKLDVRRRGRQPLLGQLKSPAARPGDIGKRKPLKSVCRSARLQKSTHLHQQLEIQEQLIQLPSPTSITLDKEHPQKSVNPFNLDRKRKRSGPLGQNHKALARGAAQERPARKRQRTSPSNRAVEGATRTDRTGTKNNDVNPIQRWVEEGSWSGGNINQDSNMAHSLTRKRSSPSLSKHESDISGVSLREGKNPVVKSRRYEQLLTSAGIYMDDDDKVATTKECKALCQALLNTDQTLPHDSLFNDDLFKRVCQRVRNKNEARVIRDLSPLLVPSAEILYLRGATNLEHLIETVDESWIKSIPLVKGPRPQPDFAVGLKSSAFTSEQIRKLQPSIGDWQTTSRLVATDEMYFPFLTSEVKCGNEALNIADRQNAHSAAVAANAVVELYRLVSRQDELNRKILAFSISHDNEAVRMYGHYALIKEKHTLFYRHPIKKFDFTSEDGEEKWSSYNFTINVLELFYPIHHERVCSAVDQLPSPEDFAVEFFSQQSNLETFEQNSSQLTTSYSQQTEPELPSSQTSGPVFKKPKGSGKK